MYAAKCLLQILVEVPLHLDSSRSRVNQFVRRQNLQYAGLYS